MKKEIMFMLCAILAATTLCTAQVKIQEKAFCEKKCAEMTKRATERMKNDLSLTDEQAAKVEALNKEYMPQMRNCRRPMHHGKRGNHPKNNECKKSDCPRAKDCPKAKECKKSDCPNVKNCPKAKTQKNDCPNTGKQPMGKSKEEVQKIRKEYKEKLNAILTPEQQKKYQTLRKERKERRKSQK
jgi:Spy/CpxP family protein refolding chaperone